MQGQASQYCDRLQYQRHCNDIQHRVRSVDYSSRDSRDSRDYSSKAGVTWGHAIPTGAYYWLCTTAALFVLLAAGVRGRGSKQCGRLRAARQLVAANYVVKCRPAADDVSECIDANTNQHESPLCCRITMQVKCQGVFGPGKSCCGVLIYSNIHLISPLFSIMMSCLLEKRICIPTYKCGLSPYLFLHFC